MTGRWINPEGYRVVKVREDDDVAWYECRLDPAAPLTFCRSDLTCWQPNRRFLPNLGSIPRAFWIIPWLDKDHFALSYLLHDSGYIHGGLWAHVDAQRARFVPLRREDVDALLYETILAEGGPAYQAAVIWSAVRLFGAAAWDRHCAARQAPSAGAFPS